jgi:hypothetical protein
MHTSIQHKNYAEMNGRSVIDVAIIVLDMIPDNEYVLKGNIATLCKDFSNQAPEVLRGSYCWIPFINILNKHISVFDTQWKIAIRNIVNGV